MEKGSNVGKMRIVYCLMVVALIVAVIVGDVMMFGKISAISGAEALKGTIMIISILVIILAIVASAIMFKVMQDEEKVSTVKSDKYKRLFLNLPIGFAQAQIMRDPQTGRNMGYRISDANETFGRLFNLDVSDYYGKVISDSKVEVLQDINAWFEAYNNSGTKQGELLAGECTTTN